MKMPWITPINDELIAKIEANDPTFHYLALYSPGVEKEAAFKLIDALENNTTLTALDLSELFKSDEVIARFAEYLKHNTSLKCLKLQCVHSSRKLPWNIDPIISALKDNTDLKNFSLEFGKLSIKNITAVVEMLPHNRGLRSLNLQRNGIDALGAQALLNAFELNFHLDEIDLGLNPILKRSAWLTFYGLQTGQSSDVLKRIKYIQKRNEYVQILERSVGIMRSEPFEPIALSSHFTRSLFSGSCDEGKNLISHCENYSNASAAEKVSAGLALLLMLENMLNKKKVDWKTLPDDMQLKHFMQTLAQPIAILQSPSLRK